MGTKKIIYLTIPTIVAMASTTIMGIVNLIVVGNLGHEAIGAVGIANVIILNLFSLFGGIGYAINYLSAQQYGAGKLEKSVNFAYSGLYIVIGISIPIIILTFLAPEYVYRILGASEEVTMLGIGYLILRLIAFCFTMIRTVLIGFLRAIGDTKISMYSGISGNLLNIFLSYILVFGLIGFPQMGIVGAGWAFLIAELLQLVYVIFKFLSIKGLPTSKVTNLKEAEIKIVGIESLKMGLEDFGMSAAMILFTAFAANLGDAELAATEIALNVLALAYLPGMGFGTTATILIGQKIGERKNSEAKTTGIKIVKVCFIFLIPLSIIYLLFSEYISSLFSMNSEVIEYTKWILTFASFFLIIDGLQLVLSGSLRALGENTFLMKSTLIIGWFIFVPAAYLLTFTFSLGLVGMWIGFYIYILMLFIVFIRKYLKIKWETIVFKE
ncbi:MATE family efflux transporter [Virgibacillus pantothenticus]|uniref:MATE family efflux transporter n=1 Tax=Virgibacillus pantothenticus TaxID=1473 RepID=UPI0009869868|nr:MATE family efflux transporter [Virgibacillus pantothenticus]